MNYLSDYIDCRHIWIPDRHAILTIRDASKIDSGPYRITAENELGQDTAIINIEISGKLPIKDTDTDPKNNHNNFRFILVLP